MCRFLQGPAIVADGKMHWSKGVSAQLLWMWLRILETELHVTKITVP
jgi:hypothetical protein